ncbi:MAG: putative O-methyltransferase [Rhodobacteraceae bacterium HLUCCA08]|nr:MAG: putative O-methyltransferase [Rhodobacteraceae bacterium HLUCCA08]
MVSKPSPDLTRDAFLGGRLTLWQPRQGYRAGVDPVLLAASVPARAGQRVLELGCGTGAALLCLGARVPGLALTGVELQPAYADLARRNADDNGIAARIACADLRDLPGELRDSYDHVLMNPPYFDRARGTGSRAADRDTAFGGDTPLADWIEVATRRLAPKGRLSVIQRIERLPELLRAIDQRLGSIAVWPVAGRAGRPPGRILLSAIKGGRAPFVLAAPLILHDGPEHGRDSEDYTAEIRAVLRAGAALGLNH